jgi:ribonuclease HI
MKTSYAAKLEFQCTNNITQYEAILLSLWKLKAMGVKTIVLKSDS